MIDITDFDVVAWVKGEMRGKLNEELARAFLIGDGRSSAAEDKIQETHIRPIWTDDVLYSVKREITEGATEAETASNLIDDTIRARKEYKGSGNPTLFTSEDVLAEMLLLKDKNGIRIYKSVDELATAMRVATISESFGSVLTTVINNSATYQNLFYTNGQALMTKIVEGFDSGNGTLSVSVVNVLTAGASAIYDQYQNWYTAGSFLDIGLAAGIRAGESNVITAAADVATKALKAAKDALQINSPSKVTYGFGRFFDLGLTNGIYDYADRVQKATETISNQALSAAQIIAENIAATMDEDFEYQPTIRPVLDMDEVDSGLNSFDRNFANRSMNLAGSINRVQKAALADKYAESVNPSQNQNGGPTTYNFTQNNYSPKALSRIDLYRQTNNQFAMMKERGKA